MLNKIFKMRPVITKFPMSTQVTAMHRATTVVYGWPAGWLPTQLSVPDRAGGILVH